MQASGHERHLLSGLIKREKARAQLKQLNDFIFLSPHNSFLKEFFFPIALWVFLGSIQALMALMQLNCVSFYEKSFQSYFQLKKWQSVVLKKAAIGI